jgi:hypothetical protein
MCDPIYSGRGRFGRGQNLMQPTELRLIIKAGWKGHEDVT